MRIEYFIFLGYNNNISIFGEDSMKKNNSDEKLMYDSMKIRILYFMIEEYLKNYNSSSFGKYFNTEENKTDIDILNREIQNGNMEILKEKRDKIHQMILKFYNDVLSHDLFYFSTINIFSDMYESYSDFLKKYGKQTKQIKELYSIYRMIVEDYKNEINENTAILLLNDRISDLERDLIIKELKIKQEKIENLEEKYKNFLKEKKEDEKKLLNTMAMFLGIFSLIGINLSFFNSGKNSNIIEIIFLIIIINITLSDTIKLIFELINSKKQIYISQTILKWISEKAKSIYSKFKTK